MDKDATLIGSENKKGIVLIVVTVAVAMLSLAGLGFVSMMSTEHKAVHVRGDELRLAAVMGSGEELLHAMFDQPVEARQAAGGWFDNPDLFRGAQVFEGEDQERRGRFSIVSPLISNDEITGMRFGAENESSRLNLFTLLRWERETPGTGREALLNLPGMTDSIADAILDWLDADSNARQFGAEEDYYVGLNLPYGPRNAVPVSLEELLLVKGVTRDRLFGADANFNHQLELEETIAAQSLGGSYQPGARLSWASLLTVHSAERNVTPRGTPRIDLNNPDLAGLHRQLTEVFDRQWCQFIVAYRQFGPDESARQTRVAENDRHAEAAYRVDLSRPAAFEFASVLDLIDAKVRVPLPPERSADRSTSHSTGRSSSRRDDRLGGGPQRETHRIVDGPFVGNPRAMQEYLPRLLDHATVGRARVIRGRVNVNDAPRCVLQAVPGLDATTVERIVARRDAPGASNDPNRRHATWLLTEGLIDMPQMKALMPNLTAGGDVFRAQIVGYLGTTGPTARMELVIDATDTPSRQVYWKDLRLLGAGYPLDALGATLQ